MEQKKNSENEVTNVLLIKIIWRVLLLLFAVLFAIIIAFLIIFFLSHPQAPSAIIHHAPANLTKVKSEIGKPWSEEFFEWVSNAIVWAMLALARSIRNTWIKGAGSVWKFKELINHIKYGMLLGVLSQSMVSAFEWIRMFSGL